jgi:hypothetical protein
MLNRLGVLIMCPEPDNNEEGIMRKLVVIDSMYIKHRKDKWLREINRNPFRMACRRIFK